MSFPHFHDDLVHRGHDSLGRLFRDAVAAILNDDLFAIRRQVSKISLQLMYPGFVEIRELLGDCGIVCLPILSSRKHDQRAIP